MPLDPLTNALLQRHMPQLPPSQAQTASMPVVPPTTPSKVPPAWKRWSIGQDIQAAYANNWSPNPVLLRVLLERA